MADEFKYWGFISYSHADEVIARKLHRALENYALPPRLARAHGLPRRLIPIFRDVDELEAASELGERLQRALDQSRWLIVLCSPAAASSKYVNDEIEYFAKRHGASRILFALVAGEPADAFPPAIKALDKEPLAADLRTGQGFELGRLKLIAAMAAVGFAELRNRVAQRQRRQRLVAGAAAASVALGSLATWDLFTREQTDYYAGYVRENGIWRGVDHFGSETASHRAWSWRFTRRGRLHPPDTVSLVDGNGRCVLDQDWLGWFEDALGQHVPGDGLGGTTPHRDYCRARFVYAGDGTIREETLEDLQGLARFSLVYTAPTLAQITRQGFADTSDGGGIRYVQFVRDRAGHDEELHFLFQDRQPRHNAAYAYGYRQTYSPEGRLERRVALDGEFQPNAFAEYYVYTSEGWLVEKHFVDGGNAPRVAPTGGSIERRTLDEWGNFVKVETLDAGRRPVENGEGTAATTLRYDRHGFVEEVCSYNALGRSMVTPMGFACGRFTRDERGRRISVSWLGPDGRPSRVSAMAREDWSWDEQDRPSGTATYDADGKPVIAFAGMTQRVRYDARGNLIELAFNDASGKPMMSKFGATIRRRFDARDHEIERRYLGTDGLPYLGPGLLSAMRRMTFDDKGNEVSRCYFDTEDRPMLERPVAKHATFGSHCIETPRDADGNIAEWRYLGLDGRPMRTRQGYAVRRVRYDQFGQPTEQHYFGPRGEPAMNLEGAYGRRDAWNVQGQLVESAWLDAAGHPRPGAYAVAITRYSRHFYVADSDDTPWAAQRVDFFDADRRPLWSEEYRLDFHGNPLETRILSPDGALTPSPRTGCAITRAVYTTNNDPIEERCLDRWEKPVNRKDKGWATHRVTAENLVPLKDEYFDAAGKPVKPRA